MRPVLFNLGPFSIHAYGFALALAFLIGILIALYYAKREGLKKEIILDLALYVIVAAILGSRIFYVVGQWDQFKDNLIEIIMVQRGGLVFLGGLLLVLLTIVWYARWKKVSALKLLDVSTPAACLGYSITRMGCFLNGCCFGLPTDLPWGVVFPPGSLAYFYFREAPLHPTQLYSMASVFVIFIIVLILYRFKKFDGQIFFWGIILYSVYRFLVEFLRYSPIHWLGLTPSQWLVLPAAALGIYGLIYNQRRLAK